MRRRVLASLVGKPLPYLRRVKSLKTTRINIKDKTPFILTNYVPNEHTELSVVFSWSGVNNASIFGFNGYKKSNSGFMVTIYNNRYYFSNGDLGTFNWYAIWQHSPLNSFVELTLKNGELSSDGTILDRRSSNWDDRIGELALFKRRIPNSTSEESYFDGEISSCVIKESGSLKVNFIPVVADRGNGEEGAMYDEARPNAGPLGNGLFFSSGNGTFDWVELET